MNISAEKKAFTKARIPAWIGTILAVTIVTALTAGGIVFGRSGLSENQQETLRILLTVCACSALYCFAVGEAADNFSQMDKLWSLLPIAYMWITAFRGGFRPRLILAALIVTAWGIRLTVNFARKGAYRLKFWTGSEDYRWRIVRANPILSRRFAWTLFDLFFISIYQNLLVLAICLPAVGYMESDVPLGPVDWIAAALAVGFLALETAADEVQWKFHETKKNLLAEAEKKGGTLADLPAPYDLGFDTVGVWGRMRHPNYLGEQGIWLALYGFAIGAGIAVRGIFHWTMTGPLLLVLLFIGSSALGEKISAGKYPRYADYAAQVWKYLPLRRFDRNGTAEERI